MKLVRVVDGLVDPLAVESAPDNSNRLFIVDRIGEIHVVRNGQLLEQPFLDIRTKVASQFLEQGLLGMAFHPDFATNGRVFVSYTDLMTGGDTVIEEYRVDATQPDRADAASARQRLRFDRPSVEHNGGTIRFGPDGLLYIGSGDGGFLGYTWNATAQEPSTLFGKILRIDVDTPETIAYRIPADNPFAAGDLDHASALADPPSDAVQRVNSGARPEIWDLGLRNPWQFSFDADGTLFIPDVGQQTREEVDVEPAGSAGGANYGWHIYEGTVCLPDRSADECGRAFVPPAIDYGRDAGDCAITGISVNEGATLDPLPRGFLYGDFCSGRVWLLHGHAGAWESSQLFDTEFLLTGGGLDRHGGVYVTSCTCATGLDTASVPVRGAVWRIEPAG